MKLKKILALLLALCLVIGMTACGATETTEATEATDVQEAAPVDDVTIRLGALKGPTSMGMSKLLTDSDAGSTVCNYTYQLAGAVDELTPLFLQGELDIVAAPSNLGSVLYGKTQGGVQALAVNTLGILYLVERGEAVTDWESLRGKTILASGKGATPEYCLNYLLESNGLTPDVDVTIQYFSEHAECVAQLAAQEGAVAMLPQPFVTVAQAKMADLRIAMDLNEEWSNLQNGNGMITATLLVRKAFAEEHPDAVAAFLQEYAASVAFVNENPAEAAQLIGQLGIVDAAVAEKAIPFCNIVCITGEEMKQSLAEYLNILLELAPDSVGGSVPGEDFYFEAP